MHIKGKGGEEETAELALQEICFLSFFFLFKSSTFLLAKPRTSYSRVNGPSAMVPLDANCKIELFFFLPCATNYLRCLCLSHF